jgi:phospholipase/lecithinase/hemolysin
VIADDMVNAMVTTPSVYGLRNVVDAACLSTAALPTCSTSTLVEGTSGASTNYLWADNLHLAMALQTRLGALALNLAKNNPF